MILLTTQLTLLSSLFSPNFVYSQDFETREPTERETAEGESIIFFETVRKSMCTTVGDMATLLSRLHDRTQTHHTW